MNSFDVFVIKGFTVFRTQLGRINPFSSVNGIELNPGEFILILQGWLYNVFSGVMIESLRLGSILYWELILKNIFPCFKLITNNFSFRETSAGTDESDFLEGLIDHGAPTNESDSLEGLTGNGSNESNKGKPFLIKFNSYMIYLQPYVSNF